MSQLVLGTAQFGHGYGITNARGRLSDVEIAEILELAQGSGITRIDTAAVYGDALVRLRPWSSSFSFTAKIVATAPVDPVDQIEASLALIDCEMFESCLVREWDHLNDVDRDVVLERMIAAREQGLINRIGVAAYTPEDVLTFLSHAKRAGIALGAAQVPANPLDRRFDRSNDIDVLTQSGYEIAVRTIFLQGLLLRKSREQVSEHADLGRYWAHVANEDSALRLCLSHVKSLPWVTQVVVGVTTVGEWRAILETWNDVQPSRAPEFLASTDGVLLDPRLWIT